MGAGAYSTSDDQRNLRHWPHLPAAARTHARLARQHRQTDIHHTMRAARRCRGQFWLTAERPTLSTYFVGCFAASESVAQTIPDECLGRPNIDK